MTGAILAIDQGTTSSRAIVFSSDGSILAQAQQDFKQHYPADGWVEHDPEEIWTSVREVAAAAFEEAARKGEPPRAIGITNQRETVVVWDRTSGEVIYPAIVWQDRRTASHCAEQRRNGLEAEISARTGLVIDPYFSASKLSWILDNVRYARKRADKGELAFGTIDSFLIWRLTGGAVHATDATNASRTNLFNIHRQDWDEHLLKLYNIPRRLLPEVKDCAADYGATVKGLLPETLPITGVAGDQQAAAVGQACFAPGQIKSTYGTGCFALMNTGEKVIQSQNRLLSTVGYRLDGEVKYAVEGSIFIAGAAVQWLRDEMGLLTSAAQTAELAAKAADDANVVMVPAFTGMGAPHWSPNARAAVFGMTRNTGANELARAALNGVIYQTHDLFAAMARDGLAAEGARIDGGMAANDWFVQGLADILGIEISRPKVLETTALGASYLAGLHTGVYSSLDDVEKNWVMDSRFEPQLDEAVRAQRLRQWQSCVQAVLAVATPSAE